MASFRERYEELFGGIPDYDPIKLEEGAKKRALNIQEAVPTIDIPGAEPTGGVPFRARTALPTEEDQGIIGNLVDLTKTGTALGAEAAVGGVEYAARQLARRDPDIVKDILESAATGLESTRGKLAAYRQSVYDMMPADVIEQKGAEFLTLDPEKTIWKGGPGEVGEAILYKFWESVPMMVGTIIPGAVLLRAGATAKGLAYLGASEGGLSLGFIANDITDGIQEMDDETLAAESPRFAQLLESLDTPEAARTQLIAEAQGLAPVIGGVLVGAISATAGRYLEPVITGKAGLSAIGRAGRGAISEGVVQEGPQETVEQVAQNIAAAIFDNDRSALEGAAEAYIQGAVVGAPGGAAVAAMVGTAGPEQREGEPPIAPAGPPAAFPDVFGDQEPPPGGYTGPPRADLFPEDRLGVTNEPVPLDIAAAVSATIREENVMDDMIENIESATPEAQQQQNLPLTGGVMAAPGRDIVPVTPQPPTLEGQGQLPLVQRQRGVPPVDVSGAPPPAPPAGPIVPEAVPTVPTEQQGELFEQVPVGVPDQPSAEPLADIQAQLVDMVSEGTTREGVFLSADNLARLTEDGIRDLIGEEGVHLVNFDNQGGLLIARNEEVAASARDLKEGGFPMQYILGQITRAGTGKPVGDTVVQVRDETGAVVRETLYETEDEAFAAAEEIGESAVVLTAAQALKRRQQLIGKERRELQKTREEREARQKAGRAIEKELPPEERAEAEEVVAGATKPTRAAARLLGLATRKGKIERARKIGDFYAPSALEFKDAQFEKDYRETFAKLVDAELIIQQPREQLVPGRPRDKEVIDAIAGAFKQRAELFEELGRIRQIAKPTRKIERIVKAAVKVSPVLTRREVAARKAVKIDLTREDYFAGQEFKVLDRGEIDALEGPALTQAFAAGAYQEFVKPLLADQTLPISQSIPISARSIARLSKSPWSITADRQG